MHLWQGVPSQCMALVQFVHIHRRYAPSSRDRSVTRVGTRIRLDIDLAASIELGIP